MRVSSSNIKSFWYSRKTHTLTVAFVGGRAYRYYNVPPAVVTGLYIAPSHGRYFYYNIRTSYNYERIR